MAILNGKEERIHYVPSQGNPDADVLAAQAAYEASVEVLDAAFAAHRAAKAAYIAAAEKAGFQKHRSCRKCREMLPLKKTYRGECRPCRMAKKAR